MTNRKIDYWVIPPQADGEFVANMEEVLETYALPYDSGHPVLCMDEQPIQLLNETRAPIAATKDHPRRVDYEYERAGTASIFMFCEPLSGWRQLAEHRRERIKLDDPSMRHRPPVRDDRPAAIGNGRLATPRQRQTTRGRLAIQGRERQDQTEVRLP